jgi:hypothetical protein
MINEMYNLEDDEAIMYNKEIDTYKDPILGKTFRIISTEELNIDRIKDKQIHSFLEKLYNIMNR